MQNLLLRKQFIFHASMSCVHRSFLQDQELFFFNDVSPGSCFFLPKGAHIYNTLTDFIKVSSNLWRPSARCRLVLFGLCFSISATAA